MSSTSTSPIKTRSGDQDHVVESLTPTMLANKWKKGGGFDALRRQMITDFLNTPAAADLRSQLGPLLPPLLTAPSFRRVQRKDRQSELMKQMDKLPAALDLRKAVGRTIEERLRVEDRRGITVDPGYGRAKRRIHVERELRETLQAAKAEARAANPTSRPSPLPTPMKRRKSKSLTGTPPPPPPSASAPSETPLDEAMEVDAAPSAEQGQSRPSGTLAETSAPTSASTVPATNEQPGELSARVDTVGVEGSAPPQETEGNPTRGDSSEAEVPEAEPPLATDHQVGLPEGPEEEAEAEEGELVG